MAVKKKTEPIPRLIGVLDTAVKKKQILTKGSY
jgi:hypothetical protein